MIQIVLKKIKPSLLSKLTSLANKHQRSLEEEIIALLENTMNNEVITTIENKGSQNIFLEEVIDDGQDQALARKAPPKTNNQQLKIKDTNGELFWQGLSKFRERIETEDIIFTDDDFANLRDKSPGREIEL